MSLHLPCPILLGLPRPLRRTHALLHHWSMTSLTQQSVCPASQRQMHPLHSRPPHHQSVPAQAVRLVGARHHALLHHRSPLCPASQLQMQLLHSLQHSVPAPMVRLVWAKMHLHHCSRLQLRSPQLPCPSLLGRSCSLRITHALLHHWSMPRFKQQSVCPASQWQMHLLHSLPPQRPHQQSVPAQMVRLVGAKTA